MSAPIEVGMILEPQAAHWTGYMDILSRLEEVTSVSVADATGGTFEPARERLGSKLGNLYENATEMLEKEKPAMALVSLEAVNAPPQIEVALDAGCDVLAEKPACIRPGDFAALVEKANGKNQHLMLAFSTRLQPMVLDAHRLVKEGHFGKLYGVEAHFIADQTRVRHFAESSQKAQQENWYFSKSRAGGGHLTWLGCHFIDMIQYVLELKVEQVSGFAGVVGGQSIEVEDSAVITFRFNNGMFGCLTSGYYLDSNKQSFFQLWGEHGWLRMWPTEGHHLEWYGTLPNDIYAPRRVFHYERGGKDGYYAFVRAAVRASAGLEPPPIGPEEGLHVLQVIDAAYRAAETGQTQIVG